MTEWFEFGSPYDDSVSYAFYQSCGSFNLFINDDALLKCLIHECEKRYPNSEIRFQLGI